MKLLILFFLTFIANVICTAQVKNNVHSKNIPSTSSTLKLANKIVDSLAATMGLYKDEARGQWYFIDETGCRRYQAGSTLTTSSYWDLAGNSGIDSASNFLGTTDSLPLFFKTNNVSRIKIFPDGKIELPENKNTNTTDTVLTTDTTGKIILTNIAQGNLLVLDSIKSIYSYSGGRALIFVKDSLRGGFFYRYSGSLPVDSGMIVNDLAGNKWKRYITDNRIRPEWYGADKSKADNYPYFMQAINYIYKTDNNSGTDPSFSSSILQLSGVEYNLSQTLVFTKHIKIEGQGTRYEPATTLHFPANTPGLQFIETKTIAQYSVDVKNISVRMDYVAPGNYDSTAHAITINCVANFENVYVLFASGDGIHIDACADTAASNYGSADAGIFINCKMANCNNGVYINGCDANQVVFQSLWSVANRRWGVYDNGFLGNHYYNLQSDFNGNKKSLVNYGTPTKCYMAIQPEDSININKQPDAANSHYWREIAPRTGVTAWNAATQYFTGGAYAIVNPNASATVFGTYSEEGEAPGFINDRVINIGGDQGSDVVGGSYMHANNAGLLLNSNLYLTGGKKIGIGTSPSASLDIDYKYSQSNTPYIARFKCDDCVSTNLLFSNSTDSVSGKSGFFGYYDKSFLTGIEDTYIYTIDTIGIKPYTTNNFELGSNTLKWKNIYSTAFSGGNWNGSVITPSFGGTGLSSLTPYSLLTGGITSSGNLQQISGLGTNGQVLTSNGSGALPSWENPNGSAVSWLLSGNAISSGNFIGTTNNQDVVIKRNNIQAGILTDASSYLTAFGVGALENNSTGAYSSAFGWNALHSNTTGNENNALGMQALLSNTTGDYNVAIGTTTLKYNTSGSYNTGIGRGALLLNTTGNYNMAIGAGTLASNTTGTENTAIGTSSLGYVTTGSYNVGIGLQALANTTGSYNTGIGNIAGSSLTSGNNNILIGYNIQPFSTTGSNQLNIGDWIKGNSGKILVSSGSSFHDDAQLEVNSTTKGLLPPRMTTTERNSISSPTEGLMLYNITTHKLNVFTGTVWEEITSN